MNQTLGFLFLVVSLNCYCAVNGINGGFFAKIENVPYMAQIQQRGKQVCGAAIISDRWILTAAHCVHDLTRGDVSVRTGSDMYSLGGSVHNVLQIIVHEEFNPKTLENDIALIELSMKITFDSKRESVRFKMNPPKKDELLQVSGFGKEGHKSKKSKFLKSMNVTVMDHDECKAAYMEIGYKATDGMFCADTLLSDACEGDSGGPAVIDGKLAGIVSFSARDCDSHFPTIYTSVLNYVKWIFENTGIKIRMFSDANNLLRLKYKNIHLYEIYNEV